MNVAGLQPGWSRLCSRVAALASLALALNALRVRGVGYAVLAIAISLAYESERYGRYAAEDRVGQHSPHVCVGSAAGRNEPHRITTTWQLAGTVKECRHSVVDFLVPLDSGPPFWFFLLNAAPFLVLALPWITLGIIFVFKGDDVDKSNRMAQLYGYTVCLIAIIVSLISISSMLDAAYQRANPLQSEMGYGSHDVL